MAGPPLTWGVSSQEWSGGKSRSRSAPFKSAVASERLLPAASVVFDTMTKPAGLDPRSEPDFDDLGESRIKLTFGRCALATDAIIPLAAGGLERTRPIFAPAFEALKPYGGTVRPPGSAEADEAPAIALILSLAVRRSLKRRSSSPRPQ